MTTLTGSGTRVNSGPALVPTRQEGTEEGSESVSAIIVALGPGSWQGQGHSPVTRTHSHWR